MRAVSAAWLLIGALIGTVITLWVANQQPDPRSHTWFTEMVASYLPSESGEGTVVAVIDTGVVEHPALVDSLADCRDFTVSIQEPARACTDTDGHGTHLAGLVAAESEEFQGLAPGVSLLALRVCDEYGVCRSGAVAAAILYSIREGADIILIGVAGPDASEEEESAIEDAIAADIVVVAPVGNQGEVGRVAYPAKARGVIGVGAVNRLGVVASFSPADRSIQAASVGDLPIDLVAPGVGILSTSARGGLELRDGTSQAAAIVAGVLARLNAASGLGGQDLVSCLLAGVEDLVDPVLDAEDFSGPDPYSGYGLVQGPFPCARAGS